MKKLLTLLTVLACALGVTAEETNAAKLALAREAIAATQVDKMLDGMTSQIKMMAMQGAQLPDTATPEQRQQFDTFMGKVTELVMAEMKTMIGRMDTVYADVYSEAELKAIVAFFNSPEGKSMLAKQPEAMARVMPLAQDMQQSLMPKLQKLAEEFETQVKGAAPAK